MKKQFFKKADVTYVASALIYTAGIFLSQFFSWGIYINIAMLSLASILVLLVSGFYLAGHTPEKKEKDSSYNRWLHALVLCIILVALYQIYTFGYMFFSGVASAVVFILFMRNVFHKEEG